MTRLFLCGFIMPEQFNEDENICFSGGAKGADLMWGQMARNEHHAVIHWSFTKHKTDASDDEVYILNDAELEQADEYLKFAAKSIKRSIPFHKPWIANLLRRNYYQVKWSKSLYAVGNFDNKGVSGGTAWAIQMFKDLYPNSDQLWFYNQASTQWYQWSLFDGWVTLTTPPKPSGQWTGIGSRALTDDGKDAISSLFD